MDKERENRFLRVLVIVMAVCSMIEAGVELLSYLSTSQ